MKITTFYGKYHLTVTQTATGYEGQAIYQDEKGTWIYAAYANGTSVAIVQGKLKDML